VIAAVIEALSTASSRVSFITVKSNSNPAMKNPTSRRMYGFTLVELLVVIAIIAVLAGAGFAAGNAAIQKAKKTTALASAAALESAVNNFYTEYGSAPVANLATDQPPFETDKAAGVTLLRVLLGAEGTGTSVLNSRAVKFLSVKEGKRVGTRGMNGLIYSTTGVPEGLYDPWGGPYKVMIDGDYDEQITVTPTGGVAARLNGRKVAAWSEGADYKSSRPGDDVITWNK